MPDMHDKDKPDSGNWTGSTASRRYTVWLILWILIGFGIITWIFAF